MRMTFHRRGPGVLLFASAVLLAACSASSGRRSAPPPPPILSIIPVPAKITAEKGSFTVDGMKAVLPEGGSGASQAASYFTGLVARSRGLAFAPGGDNRHAIVFRTLRDSASTGAEGYRIDIQSGGIVVSASEPAGLFYGGITLWQLLTQTPGPAQSIVLPASHIEDAPRFAWRGLMLDSVRHFQSPAFVKSLLDAMAIHKLNVLQWHLTDDQGWRIEIKKYPRLTKIGAWRVPAGAAAAKDIDPKTGKPRLYGGYYTQDEIRDIVAYAEARHIVIVPEIEMPGHALAAIVAYPRLGSVKDLPRVISGDWGVFPYLYNVDDSTFGFLENVLTEAMALFPSRYIHVGGDEAVKDQWKASPRVQTRMRALGIPDEEALQSYFIARIGRFLGAHGRRLIGWDDILQGGIAPDATVMSWRGIDGAIAAAKAGHNAVLSPAPVLYFDNRQSELSSEPPGRGAVVSLEDVYGFDPAPTTLSAPERARIVGLQGNLWTEHIRGEEQVSYMAFPRAAALAELAWSPADKHDWHGFLARLPAQFGRYRALGISFATSAFDVRVEAKAGPKPGRSTVTLSDQANSGDIRYTLDGSAPSRDSNLYTAPLEMSLPSALRAATFAGNERISRVSLNRIDARSLLRRDSHRLKLCTSNIALSLEDDAPLSGPRAGFLVDIMNPCWLYERANLSGIGAIKASVGWVPFNFQVGADREKIPLHAPRTADGELEIHRDTCDGPLIGELPLAPAVKNDTLTVLSGRIVPRNGTHDLCLFFTRRKVDPIWTLDWVELEPGPP